MHKLLLILTTCVASLYPAADEPNDLFFHIARGNLNETRHLLNAHPDWLEIRNEFGQTPLCIALINARTLIIRDLIETRHANANARDDKGQSMFFYALDHIYLRREYCILLLEHGHDLYYYAPGNSSILTMVTRYNMPEVIEILLKKGVPANLQDGNGINALEIAAGNNNTVIAQLLLEYDADINKHSGLGKGPIGWAQYYKRNKNKPKLLHVLTHTKPKVEHILPCDPIAYLQQRESGLHCKRRRKQ